MITNNSPTFLSDSQAINFNLSTNQNIQMPPMKKYWCHLCKKEFSHIYENDDIKCSFCGKTFCEIIENEDTSNASHPINFEPFILNNINSQNNINNSQNENGGNNRINI